MDSLYLGCMSLWVYQAYLCTCTTFYTMESSPTQPEDDQLTLTSEPEPESEPASMIVQEIMFASSTKELSPFYLRYRVRKIKYMMKNLDSQSISLTYSTRQGMSSSLRLRGSLGPGSFFRKTEYKSAPTISVDQVLVKSVRYFI
jgi:hypothetical protein